LEGFNEVQREIARVETELENLKQKKVDTEKLLR
jgi:hypothetical protein